MHVGFVWNVCRGSQTQPEMDPARCPTLQPVDALGISSEGTLIKTAVRERRRRRKKENSPLSSAGGEKSRKTKREEEEEEVGWRRRREELQLDRSTRGGASD